MNKNINENNVVLEMRNVTKRFPGVTALKDVSLKLYKGETLAICGENGAGKSTLMKVLSGRMRVRAPSINTMIVNLSGGNQQKVVLGKSLLAQPDILFIDEPTKGIDVGAKAEIYKLKIAGAMADEMASLDEVKRVTQKAVDNTRSLGVALGPCTIPLVGKPNFEISDDEMEIGMGIHGEQGVERVKMRTADEIAANLVDRVVNDMPFVAGDEVAVLVNSLGATPLEELYVLYRKIDDLLREKGLVLHRPYVGRYACSMEMQGMSLSLMKLDDELKRLLDAPADSPFFKQF